MTKDYGNLKYVSTSCTILIAPYDEKNDEVGLLSSHECFSSQMIGEDFQKNVIKNAKLIFQYSFDQQWHFNALENPISPSVLEIQLQVFHRYQSKTQLFGPR